MHEIRIPEMGESITEGTISAWIKQDGETVKQGEVLAEIETDKVNVELSAEADGVLQIKKQAGEDVQIGEIVGIIQAEAFTVAGVQSNVEADSGAVESADTVGQNNHLKQVETANTNYVGNVENDLYHRHGSPAERKRARERQLQMGIQSSPIADQASEQDEPQHLSTTDSGANSQTPASSNVTDNSISQVKNSQDRTVKDLSGEEQSFRSDPSQAVQTNPMQSEQKVDDDARIERVKMSRRRKTIATRLLEAQHNAAMLTTFNEVDLSAVMEIRKRRKEEFLEEYQVKLGFMSFFTKAVVTALKVFPYLNAEIQGDEMIIKKFYDIGIAVSTDEGLVVPVVRNADQLNFAEIEHEIARLAERARNNELSLADLQGGTFTITNGGVFGSLLSTPILNPPQVGILGMHTIQHRPVAIERKRVEIRPMMYIALSYDHRIVDGKEAVQFLVKVKQLLEDPEHLLLQG